MKNLVYLFILIGFSVFAQEELKPQDQKYIYEGNQELKKDDFVNAEAAYRNAIYYLKKRL